MTDRLISLQAAIDALDEIESEIADGYGYQYEKWRKYFSALPSAQPEQRWIPVSERFPEEGEEVLVYLFDGKSPYLAWIQDGLWRTEDFVVDADYEPVAWMPLPKPYQAERREEP